VDGLYAELTRRRDEVTAARIKSVTAIGDSLAPGTIAAAVFSGHRYAREFERPPTDAVPFLRETAELGPWRAAGTPISPKTSERLEAEQA
jgi:dimethylamine/trimethylamine dehydrogenase